MNIYAIRHTKPDIEPGICYGQSDLNVAESFTSEQKIVADNLHDISFDSVYCSPLQRCKILAENTFKEVPIIFDNRLKELDFGDWELKPWDDIYSEEYGKVWFENYQEMKAPNGESYPEMRQRVKDFLSEVKEKGCHTIAVFTHAGVIRLMKSIIEDYSVSELFKNFKPEYGSVTLLRTDGEKDGRQKN